MRLKKTCMMCEICNQNPAVIHIEKHQGEEKTQIRLCLDCAGMRDVLPENLNTEKLQSIIENIAESKKRLQQGEQKACPNCHIDYSSIELGITGCPSCYKNLVTKKELSRWQKTSRLKYIGKTPYNFRIQQPTVKIKLKELKVLEDKLSFYISQEDYENAALLRDQIESIRKMNS